MGFNYFMEIMVLACCVAKSRDWRRTGTKDRSLTEKPLLGSNENRYGPFSIPIILLITRGD